MDVKVLTQEDTSLTLRFDDTDPTVVNSIRRTLLADVPKMAIEDVEFHLGPIRAEDGKEYESVAPLFDEIISHRLGLVPIPTDLQLYVPKATCPNCHGEGCSNCTIIYSVNKRGPGVVTSGDLEPIGDPKLKPKDALIPIVKLGDGQALLIYATAILGTGRDHAKWQVAHGVGYSFTTILKAGGKAFEAQDAKVPPCPDHILRPGNEEVTVELRTDCKNCRKFADAYDVKSVKVFNDPSKIRLQFETDGSLSARETLIAALDILEKRFADLAGKAEQL
ncbi:MAG: DNA-directed RNA polymerase subunit D [Methanobacteriota archaeon]|nr:MAG: DNA-directed RNA polymerase subunit D [Euryarchaeota archaeon]